MRKSIDNRCSIWFSLLFLVGSTAATADPWLPVLSNEDAWNRLPPAVSGAGEPLPIWARVLAPALPATTAAMLEMDRAQRCESGLGDQTRAEIRWAAARANGGRYALEQARADFVRAGGNVKELESASLSDLPPQSQQLQTFTRRMCQSAYEVTDDEVNQLLQEWGPERLTTIVLVIAYSNFQDRVLNAIGVTTEPGGPLPPPAAKFDWKQAERAVPERVVPPETDDARSVPTRVSDADWLEAPFADLRQRLDGQQVRASRIPIPSDDLLRERMPAEHYQAGRSERIRWNCVTYGYQPLLTAAWFRTLKQFRRESGLPDDLRQSAFWVVTRSNWCFY